MTRYTGRVMIMLRLAAAHKTFAILLATIVLMEIAHGIELIALFPLYLHDNMNEGADIIGVTLSSYLIADILTRTPAGWGADRWARKPVLVLGITLSALPLLAMPRVSSRELFLALNAINGIGAGCIWPAIYASVADAYGRERYGLVLGIVNLVMLGGIALGPIAGGLLLSRASYEMGFRVCFLIVLASLLLVSVLFRASPRGTGEAVKESQTLGKLAPQFNPVLLQLLLIGLLLTFALGMLLPLISLFGKEVLRVTPDTLALILIPPAILAAVFIIPAGHLTDRRGRRRPLIFGLVLIAIPFAAAPLSINPLVVSAGASIAALGYALVAPAWNAFMMDWIPERSRGLFLGMVATAQGIGLALGPLLGGALWEAVGVYAPFQVAAFLLGLAAAGSWLARLEQRDKPEPVLIRP